MYVNIQTLAKLSAIASKVKVGTDTFAKVEHAPQLLAINTGLKSIVAKLTTQRNTTSVEEKAYLQALSKQLNAFLVEIDDEPLVNTKENIPVYNALVDACQELQTFEI